MKPGDEIGKYRLDECLGRGGMGEVWLATASGYGGFTKQVVLKTLLAEYEDDPLFVEMLANEARTCGKLHHPNLIEVFDFAKVGAVYLLAMEHVVGESLAQILRVTTVRGWPLPAWFALRVAWECCRGLESAHASGVIHCDLSPSNVMITYTGLTKIVDFGVAHLRADGDRADRLKGKFSYMPPERFKSLATDQRTDVYALGMMLYLLFCGRLPYTGKTDAEIVRMKMSRLPAPSTHGAVDPDIEDVIMRAIEPDPRARFQSATEMLVALSPLLAGQLGTYGQHDVAGLMSRLFADDMPEVHAEGTESSVADESSSAISISFEVDVDLEDLVVPARALTTPASPPALARMFDRGDRAPTEEWDWPWPKSMKERS